MFKNRTYIAVFLGIIFSAASLCAQQTSEEEPMDDLGKVNDAFQENFFEALKQKGIENHELALEALKKAERLAKKNPEQIAVVYFEMGKNQKSLKRFTEAEASFTKVLEIKKEQVDVMEAMYDLYYLQNAYSKAITLVQKLIRYDEDYKEDLANLYHRTKQYENALSLLDELDETWGESVYRNSLRQQIYRVTGNREGAIENLETKIDKNPKNEQDYLNLIFLYSDQGQEEKAFATAEALLKNNPESKLVHLALYKFYLDRGSISDAMNSMAIVFKASTIEKEPKYRVLSDFLSFVQEHSEYEEELETVIQIFSSETNGEVYEQLGDYFLTKGNKEKALSFFEKGIALDEDNFSLLKNTLLLQIDTYRFENAIALSEEGLGNFPAQPLLYLVNGVAHNSLEHTDQAIESLETGIDFLFDNPSMEKDFYEQLSIAYTKKGNKNKAEDYTKKAAAISLDN